MNSNENYIDGRWGGLARGAGFPRGAEFFTSPPYLSCRDLSESQNNFSIVCLDQRPRTFDEVVGSLRTEYRQLKWVGHFFETVFYCNSRHWFPSF